ncbi:MAG: VPLPA-CTERM sorting domain-containing protein [Nitrincola lacisaponensis]|uniref:VPLPA-CTERM sorting domain-containing protein n=1 Tax=Nitrincola lacisaponensis TaxID=267850 RepID=UPI003919DE51
MKKLIGLIVLAVCLMGAKAFAAPVPSNTNGCSGFSLSGGECLLSGSSRGSQGTNLTSNPSNNGFLINPAGEGYSYITKFEGGNTIWSSEGGSTVITLPESISSMFSQIAIGIKQGPVWAVFLIDTALGSYTFNQNGISNVTFYSAANIAETPLPAAAWLFLTGLAGVLGLRARQRKKAQG